MKKLVTISILLAASSLAWSQMTSSKQGTWNKAAIVSSFDDCLRTNNNVNCWYQTTGFGTGAFSGFGHTLAVTSSLAGFSFNDFGSSAPNTWTYHPEWGEVYELRYAGDGNLYALIGSCGGTGHSIGKWSGSSWTAISPSTCLRTFSPAADSGALFLGLDPSGVLWGSNSHGSGTWTKYSMPNSLTALSVATIKSGTNLSSMYYLVLSDNTIWYKNSKGWTKLPGAAKLIAAKSNAIYVIGTNGDVYHLNSSKQWDQLVTPGPATNLSVADGEFNVWTTAAASGLYRFGEHSLQLSRSYSGSVACGPGVPTAECNTFHHTAQLQIGVGKSAVGSLATATPWNGNGSWGLTATVTAHPQDVLSCLASNEPADCDSFENTGNMECTGGGSNQDNGPSITIAWETAYTRMQNDGGAVVCGFDFGVSTLCPYVNISPDCLPASGTGPVIPDFIPLEVDGYYNDDLGFDVSSLMFSVDDEPWVGLGTGAVTPDVEYGGHSGRPWPGASHDCTQVPPSSIP